MSLSKPEGFPGLPQGWEYKTLSLASADGECMLFVSHFVKATLPKAPRILFVLHGQGEHGGRYQHFPAFLEDAVDLVVSLDHRGHGRSQGVRGHVERFEQYVDDAYLALQKTIELYSDPETGRQPIVHLLGHSMGGLIALLVLQEKSVTFLKSATISAPLLALKFKVPVVKQLAGQVLSRLMGGLQMETGLDCSLISHDEHVVRAYQNDLLVHSKASARFFTEMLGASERCRIRDSGIFVPVQFLVPMEDGIVSAETTLRFFEALKHPDKKLVQYDGFFHESFNEKDKLRAFGDLRTWIRGHT